MDNSNVTEDEKKISGNELDELDDEKESSGNELDESEDEKEFSGSELDESEDEKEFSGSELDESEDEKEIPIPEVDTPGSKWKTLWGKGKPAAIAAGVLLSGASVFFYLWGGSPLSSGPGKSHRSEKTVHYAVPKVPDMDKVTLQSFVIPAGATEQFTYFTLSVSVYPQKKELREEMLRKKCQIRGIIYGLLSEETNRIKKVPPLEKIKGLIIGGVNSALSAGEIINVYVTQFIAV